MLKEQVSLAKDYRDLTATPLEVDCSVFVDSCCFY